MSSNSKSRRLRGAVPCRPVVRSAAAPGVSARAPRINGLLALSLVALLAVGTASAEGFQRWASFADTDFHHYTADQGLPNPIATALAQDADGFLWVGTQGGLGRWDGYRFRNYLPNPTDPKALPGSYITTLHTDSRGRLWIGTAASGLARYDPETDSFIVYPAGTGGLSHAYVWAIADDGSGGLWIGTDGGLDHLNPATGVIESLHHHLHDASSLPDDRVQALLRDRSGALWVGTRTGLARRDPASNAFVAVPVITGKDNNVSIVALFQDDPGRVWIGTDRGAFVFDKPNTPPHPITESGSAVAALSHEEINTIEIGGPSEIWLGTFHQGIVAVDTATGQVRRIRHDQSAPESLMHDQVYFIFRDREGSVWVANSRGLDRCANCETAVSTVFRVFSHTGNDVAVDADAVMAAGDGRVWVGFNDGGVDILDLVNGHIASLRPNPSQPDSALPKAGVYAFAADGEQRYIGTRRGLYRSGPEGHDIARVAMPKSDLRVGIRSLLVDDGTLWIGSGGDGLWEIDLKSGSRAVHQRLTADQLTDGRVVALERGTGSDLWIGTLIGLNRLDLTSGKLERIPPDPTNPSSLSAGFVSALAVDRRGRLWAGTLGGGIQVMTGRDAAGKPEFKHIGDAEGLPNANIDKLLVDAQGKIWASTDSGLAVIDPDTLVVHALGAADGVEIGDYWVNSGVVTTGGELLFGGEGGLSVIHPDRLNAWNYRPPVVVTDARVGGKFISASRFNGSGSTTPLVLTPRADSLSVEFAALDYTAPEQNQYAYRLDGFDRDWVDTDAQRRTAAYTNLPPGHYTLVLRGSNRNGLWTRTILKIPIFVQAAWYQTLWFYFCMVAIGVAIIVTAVQLRNAHFRRRQQELQRLVEERTAELRESQRQLEEIAYIDVLTSLPNRRMFTDEFRQLAASASRRESRFTLVLLDFDRFKRINDTLGHDAGDAVLVEAARRLKAVSRSADTVYRLGGDEFAMLLPDTERADQIEVVCRRILESFAETFLLREMAIEISPCIGVAIYPDHGDTQEALYKATDVALYQAKRAGGNTWCLYSAHLGAQSPITEQRT